MKKDTNTPSEQLQLSIIIPAYKEANKIERDIEAAAHFLKTQAQAAEIIVVDDGSPDETTAVVQSLQKDFPQLQVLRYESNRGKGYALRYGIIHSRGEKVMFADAGLCIPYEIALIALTMLDLKMCEIAHGSRRMRGSVRQQQPLYRRIGSKVYSFVIHTLMGVPLYISDTQCGFKLYQGDIARQLYGEAFTDGFMIDIEIILRALASGYVILEFPVLWSNDADTRYDPIKGTWRNFLELMAIRWQLSRRRDKISAK